MSNKKYIHINQDNTIEVVDWFRHADTREFFIQFNSSGGLVGDFGIYGRTPKIEITAVYIHVDIVDDMLDELFKAKIISTLT